MNKKLISALSVFAFAFALVFFAAPHVVKANQDNYNQSFIGQSDLFGVDEANTSASRLPDRDTAPARPDFQTYGLQGDWSQVR